MRSSVFISVLWALVLVGCTEALADRRKPTLDEWFPHLREGMWIKVEGNFTENEALYATEVKILNGELDESEITSRVDEIEVTRMSFLTQLGVKVIATTRTEMKGPKENKQVGFSFIQVGDRVEVEGQLQKDGTLLAEEIEVKKSKRLDASFKDKNKHEVKARIESIDPKLYSVELMGIRVYFTPKTKNKTPLLD